jgi:hypothetical protein
MKEMREVIKTKSELLVFRLMSPFDRKAVV